ncbi:xanthine dehydrogenase small subunit [Halioglobus sp. HI00S01]|uniref:xanthine dehydrogenase small subunit n=1 Tax=Halioglobus sp. HI00S01 TaxID=1822214 RepID=UPI0007C2E1CC|nr:xanthine dehydrogenase small subunit [Halioglobus sp. HI00S01]KZX57086.1 xanthine dehydrogenase small subunit [Halioglobus sp. HI00S01]
MITFLLNSIEHRIDDIDPNTTVLDYLRDHLGRTGTKEGCASGDCGACTVVVARVSADNQLQYRSINACITPIGSLHGQQLLTVEDLAADGDLHPAQEAMVECHGSQCGFCTPGFVMSLYAHYQNHAQPDRQEILESLGGNLCRCTGYRPILDAAVAMYDPALEATHDQPPHNVRGTLAAMAQVPADLQGDNHRYFAPQSSAELAALYLQHPDARLVAGATDLSLELTQSLATITTLIHTGRATDLTDIQETSNHLDIGAAVTYSDSAPLLLHQWPELHELLERLGSKQIRNQGTIGGNIGNASPIGDMPPVLLALNASVILRCGEQRRSVPLDTFFVGYRRTVLGKGEFIERIHVPRRHASTLFRAYKISKRIDDDISTVCGAFALDMDGDRVTSARIAYGGMAEIPRRAHYCEDALRDKPLTETTINAAVAALAEDFCPISDFRASADYRMQVAGNLLRRLQLSHNLPAQQLQVTHYA